MRSESTTGPRSSLSDPEPILERQALSTRPFRPKLAAEQEKSFVPFSDLSTIASVHDVRPMHFGLKSISMFATIE
jgi:hypothetical protein